MNRATLRQPPAGIKRRALIVGAGAAVILAAPTAWAAPRIEILRPWLRYTNRPTTSAYFTLVNHTDEADLLKSVTSPWTEKCVIQEMKWKGLNPRMVEIRELKIPALSRVVLSPDGMRITMKLSRQMSMMDKFPLTLTFEKAGRIDLEVEITDRLLGPE